MFHVLLERPLLTPQQPLPVPIFFKAQQIYESTSRHLSSYNTKQSTIIASPRRPYALWHYMHFYRVTFGQVQSTVYFLSNRSHRHVQTFQTQYRTGICSASGKALQFSKQSYCPIFRLIELSILDPEP